MSNRPEVSVIIPAYNRVEPLRLTLRSALEAARAISTEIILVDDGSEPPLSTVLSPEPRIRILRQANQGSMVARQAGLAAAQGEYILFLDSDDLIHPDKLRRQATAMRAADADISYSDMAHYQVTKDGRTEFSAGERLPPPPDTIDFLLRLQPAPHNPIYRRQYLSAALAKPLVPMDRRYDAVGDIWIYFNLLLHPARVIKVDGPLTAIGVHDEARFSGHWEKLGAASLQLMEDFMAACPAAAATTRARTAIGECAFISWRRLPRDFDGGFDARMLALWRRAPRGPLARLGEKWFVVLARMIGPETAARWLRRLRGHSYASCRTLTDAEFRDFCATLARRAPLPPRTAASAVR